MKLLELNPFVRMASHIYYNPTNADGFPRDCRIIYITEGTADIFVQNKHYTLSKNSLFYCASGIVYKICGAKPLQLYVLNFDLTCDNSDHTKILPIIPPNEAKDFESIQIDNSEFLNSHIFIPDGSLFKSLICETTDEMINKKQFFKENSSGLLKQLIIGLHRMGEHNPQKQSRLFPVLEFIHKNYTSDINNKQLASIAGYHEYHLNRIFSAKTGKSIHKYIIDLRLEKAKQLLLSTETPLGIISETCGFTSNTYFSSYFKKQTGITPNQYRNKYSRIL